MYALDVIQHLENDNSAIGELPVLPTKSLRSASLIRYIQNSGRHLMTLLDITYGMHRHAWLQWFSNTGSLSIRVIISEWQHRILSTRRYLHTFLKHQPRLALWGYDQVFPNMAIVKKDPI